MNQLLQLTTFAILFTIVLSVPITGDHSKKQFEDECKQAKNYLTSAIKQYEDNVYVQTFGKVLIDGINRLEKRTDEVIKNTTDEAKKQEAINFGYESCERAYLFIKDIEDKLKQ
uniref:Uncharacterized protein LOC113799284 n=1 Tax=Dermatophagoides pteronyssinus TaxID=6956 RepID=A0A6P6YLN3_DERPT|nr:uncharacterized protein LOC113799284 [Dermatophagoides pteronyssinus]